MEYFCDDIQPLLGRGELVAVLVALYEAEDKVPDVEGLVPYPSSVVPSQRLLVLGRMEEGNVTASSSWSMASWLFASAPYSSYALILGAS